MKILIASDIHGSEFYLQKLLQRFAEEGAEQMILLGDIYNHGPRNPLPEGYRPLGVAALLNPLADRLTVVKGNCDSDVDTLISDFEFVPEAQIYADGKKIFLQHGDKFDFDRLPKNCGDAFVFGHIHTGFIRRKGGVLVANAGSVSPSQKRYAALVSDFGKGRTFAQRFRRERARARTDIIETKVGYK